jgi:HD-like signal output (HDOD) protein
MAARDLDTWVSRFNNQEMPIFSATMLNINGFSRNDRSPTNELTQRILEDVSLTAKVLKLANSVYYKPDQVRINTVHWAVMRLGYNSVKDLCSGSPLVENLLRGEQRERVIRERMKALHAATQARSFAATQFASGIEEVFIAASLLRLGHLAFYCFGEEVADDLETCLSTPGCSRMKAERKVLGFRLDELTAALSKEWKLCDLLQASVEGRQKADFRVPHVLLGHNLAETVESGWDSPQVQRTLQAISNTLNKSIEDVTKLAHANAHKAIQVGRDLGLARHIHVIPVPDQKKEDQEEVAPSPQDASAGKSVPAQEYELMQELSRLLRKGCLDINLFFSTLLEGIMRGAGVDRVLLAILTPDLSSIVGKYGRGWEREEVKHFIFSRKSSVPHVFEYVLEAQKAVWIDVRKEGESLRLLTPEVRSVMPASSFFVMPIVIKSRAIGLICADRYPSRRELDQESYASFLRIQQLANETLASMV